MDRMIKKTQGFKAGYRRYVIKGSAREVGVKQQVFPFEINCTLSNFTLQTVDFVNKQLGEVNLVSGSVVLSIGI